MKYSKYILFCFVFLFVFHSCRKEIDIEIEKEIVKGPSTQVIGSVFGVVKDINGEPIADASVRISTNSTFTDENGIFKFKNISLTKNYEVFFNEISEIFPKDNVSQKLRGSYITIEKDGYFLGSKRFYPELGQTNNIEIHLLEEVLISSFESEQGAMISFDNVDMVFEKNTVIDESGNKYNGPVEVYCQYLDPTEIEVMNTMPGDLTGISVDDGQVSLSSYGMIAVELKDNQGNPLQIADGQFVEVHFPIPNSLQSSAPNTIPIWSFHETEGIWIEEGEASAKNMKYVAQLPHFSFWNCDIPFPAIFLNGNIQNSSGPIENAFIKISAESLGISGTGFSNVNGDFSGYVPANELLLLEAINYCGEVYYSIEIGPFSDDNFVNINTELIENNSLIVGSVSSCLSSPSPETYIQTNYNNQTQFYQIDDMNQFEKNLIYCEPDDEILVQAIDPINGVISSEVLMNLVDTVDFGELELCDTLYTEHYIKKYGDIYKFYSPIDGSLEITLDSFSDPTSGLVSNYLLDTKITDLSVGNTTLQAWLIDLENPENYGTFTVFEAGFKASGFITGQIVYQNGFRWAVISGTLSDIEVTDPELYDSTYTELYFHITGKI